MCAKAEGWNLWCDSKKKWGCWPVRPQLHSETFICSDENLYLLTEVFLFGFFFTFAFEVYSYSAFTLQATWSISHPEFIQFPLEMQWDNLFNKSLFQDKLATDSWTSPLAIRDSAVLHFPTDMTIQRSDVLSFYLKDLSCIQFKSSAFMFL